MYINLQYRTIIDIDASHCSPFTYIPSWQTDRAVGEDTG